MRSITFVCRASSTLIKFNATALPAKEFAFILSLAKDNGYAQIPSFFFVENIGHSHISLPANTMSLATSNVRNVCALTRRFNDQI